MTKTRETCRCARPSRWRPDETVTGDVLYLSDFHVTLKDASGKRHTISRQGDVPKVDIVDPLHAHVALLRTLSDKAMHDLTAFLATLK